MEWESMYLYVGDFCLNIHPVVPGIGISIIKIRRSLDHPIVYFKIKSQPLKQTLHMNRVLLLAETWTTRSQTIQREQTPSDEDYKHDFDRQVRT